jgi:hypothetical protein
MFKFVRFFHEVLIDSFETVKVSGHTLKLLIDVRPRRLRNPSRWVVWYFNITTWSDKQESKLMLAQFFITEQYLGC